MSSELVAWLLVLLVPVSLLLATWLAVRLLKVGISQRKHRDPTFDQL